MAVRRRRNLTDKSKEKKRKDVFEALSPLLWINRLIGIAPFHFRSGEYKGRALLLTYSALIFLITAPAGITATFEDFASRKDNSLSTILDLFWSFVDLNVSVISYIFIFLRSGKLYSILDGITRLDQSIRQLQPRDLSVITKREANVQVICFVASFPFYLYLFKFNNPQEMNFLEYAISSFTIVLRVASLSQGFNVFRLFRQRLSTINDIIGSIGKNRLDGFVGKNRASKLRLKKEEELIVDETQYVKRVADIHLRTFTLLVSANRIYGEVFLLQFGYILVDSTLQCFFIAVYAISDPIKQMFEIPRFFMYLVVVTLVTITCEGLKKESQRTRDTTSEAMNTAHNMETRKELQIFSNQLLHTEMKFTACGFFTLDFNLLTSMAAAIVTNVVILIQFQHDNLKTKNTMTDSNYVIEKNITTDFNTTY